ncbi:MAG: O-methyltransferase [Acidimicrobiales bacterium]
MTHPEVPFEPVTTPPADPGASLPEPIEQRCLEVDRYIVDTLVGHDDALEAALEASGEAGLPPIQVSPPQGKLLSLLVQSSRATTVLEIGTLGGYSTIWLARALPPGGRLVTLEVEPRHAEVARANLSRAGLSEVVDIRLGRALDSLAAIEQEGGGPFDFTFIDADKPSNAEYFARALRLSGPGSLIVVDNVVRDGRVVDADSPDADVVGTRRLYDAISREPRVSATAIQTVGGKGYDGFAVAVVLGGE